MKSDEIIQYCLENLSGTVLTESWGERGIFYNPEGKLKRGIYTLTIKEKDGSNDKASNLDRLGIYRVNLALKKPTFKKLFTDIPKRPDAGGVVEMPYNFQETNIILPHPVYAWMSWICMLSPDENGFEQLKPYIQESYQLALEKYKKKKV